MKVSQIHVEHVYRICHIFVLCGKDMPQQYNLICVSNLSMHRKIFVTYIYMQYNQNLISKLEWDFYFYFYISVGMTLSVSAGSV